MWVQVMWLMEAVPAKFAHRWKGTTTLFDNVMWCLEEYCEDIEALPCLIARLELIERKGGDLSITWAEKVAILKTAYEVEQESEAEEDETEEEKKQEKKSDEPEKEPEMEEEEDRDALLKDLEKAAKPDSDSGEEEEEMGDEEEDEMEE